MTEDKELEAINTIARIMKDIGKVAQHRVLRWAAERYGYRAIEPQTQAIVYTEWSKQ